LIQEKVRKKIIKKKDLIDAFFKVLRGARCWRVFRVCLVGLVRDAHRRAQCTAESVTERERQKKRSGENFFGCPQQMQKFKKKRKQKKRK
jgi:hypothetical protein